jgi:hypothetical protein
MKVKRKDGKKFEPIVFEVTVETAEEFANLTRAAVEEDCCPARDEFVEFAQLASGLGK